MKNSLLRNFSYSLTSNIISFLISLCVAFVVPKYLGVKEYAYWQLYSFYVAYRGILHFGWVDGIYLKYGGEKYCDLDKNVLHAQFILLVILEIIVTVGIFIFSNFMMQDTNKKFVAMCFGIACLIYLPATFLQYLLQATNRIVEYAKCVFFERIIYVSFIICFLLFGVRKFQVMVLADLFAGCFTLFAMMYICKDMILIKGNYAKGITEAFSNMSIGSKLLIGNVGGALIIGITRQYIEMQWGIEVFGKISLTLSASSMLTVLINAISLVLYPVIRNLNEKKLKSLFFLLEDALAIVICGLLITYFPVKEVLSDWLPQYAESLRYMALLFPMCLFESLYYLLVTTYLKALRKEKIIMLINWITVLCTVALLILFSKNLTLTVMTITVGLGIRYSIGYFYIAKLFESTKISRLIVNWIMAISFMLSAWNGGGRGFFLYFLLYLIYLVFKMRKIKEIGSLVSEKIGASSNKEV